MLETDHGSVGSGSTLHVLSVEEHWFCNQMDLCSSIRSSLGHVVLRSLSGHVA